LIYEEIEMTAAFPRHQNEFLSELQPWIFSC